MRQSISVLLIVCGLAALPAAAGTANKVHPADEFCSAQWRQLKPQNGQDWSALRKAWTALEDRCRDTGLYEFHLATIEENLGNVDKAIEILDAALKRDLPYHDFSYIALSDTRFRRLMLATPPDKENAAKLTADLESFMRERPNLSFGLLLLANQELMLGNYDRGLKIARDTLALEPDNVVSKRAIFICQVKLGQYQEARAGIKPLITAHRDLAGDAGFMYAVSEAYLALGDVESAEGALVVLRDRSPQVNNDDEFRALARRVLIAKGAAPKSAG